MFRASRSLGYGAEMASPLDDDRLTAVGLLIETFDGLTRELAAVHGSFGLGGKDFDALLRLARSPDRRLRMTDLAAQTGLSTSGITRVVDRLESEGLIERLLSSADRRSWLAVLTDAGYELLVKDVATLLGTIDRCFLEPLGDREAPFLDGLRRVRDHLRPEATAGAQG